MPDLKRKIAENIRKLRERDKELVDIRNRVLNDRQKTIESEKAELLRPK